MKKLLFILSVIFYSTSSFAQGYPINQNLGAPKTLINVKGGLSVDSSLVFIYNFPDTATASLGFLDNIPGNLIRAKDTLWQRNNVATAWIKLGSGGGSGVIPTFAEVLNAGAILDDTYEVDGNTVNSFNWADFNTYTFQNIQDFRITALSELDLAALDSMRLIGVDESAPNGLYVALLNPATGAVTKTHPTNVGDSSFTSILVGANKNFIGDRYTYDWATNPFAGNWQDNTPAVTITPDGTSTTFSGGTFAAGNNIAQPFYIGVENFTITLPRVVVKAKNNTSYGFSYIISGSVAGTAALSSFFLLSDTVGRVAYTATGSLPDYNGINSRTTTNFIWSVNDTLECTMERRGTIVTTTMKNLTNGITAQVQATDQYCTVGLFSLNFYGGTWEFLDEFVITYDEIENPSVAGVGNSVFSGATADYNATDWWNVATEGVSDGLVHMGAGFEQSLQGTLRMEDVLLVNPSALFIEYGINDALQSIDLDSFSARIRRIVDPCVSAGIVPIIVGVVPQASVDVTVYDDTLQAIATQKGIPFVDVFEALRGSAVTTINTIYASGDGVHPNQAGHSLMGNMAKTKLSYLFPYDPPLTSQTMPTIIEPAEYLAIDQYGKIAKAAWGVSNGYIQNIAFENGNSLSDGQDASLFIQGSAYMGGSFAVQGNSGTFSNPNFIVNAATGITSASTLAAGTFSSGNFSISTGPTLNGGNFIWTGNPVNMTLSPFVIMVSNPAGNGITSGFTIDNNTTDYTNATDVIQRWRKSGATVASVLRDGHIRSNVASGYNFNINGTLSTNDWITKGYADSIAAVLGSPWNAITNPTGDQALTFDAGESSTWTSSNTTEDLLTVNTSTLTTGSVFSLNSTSTALASGNNLAEFVMSGANGTSSITATAVRAVVTNTGTTSNNTAIFGSASGATYNYSGWFNERLSVGGASIAAGSANRAVMVRSLSNVFSEGTIYYPNANYATSLEIGYGGILTSADFTLSVVGGDATFNAAQSYFGGVADPTAKIHIAAGATGAGTAPLKFISGTSMTTAEAGAVEYTTDDLFFTIATGTARKRFVFADPTAGLTSGQLAYATTNGRLTGSANLTITGGGGLTIGSSGATINSVLSNTAALDFPNTTAGTSSDLTITVTGAALNDVVMIGTPAGSVPDNGVFSAWVSASNTVTIRYSNNDLANAKDPAIGTFRATVIVH